MARALTAVGVALVLLMGGLALAVFLTRDEDNLQVDNLLAERLSRDIALAERRGEDVDLAAAAPFPWESVLVVARDTGDAAISRRLGYEWNGVIGFRMGELLLFMEGGRAVRFADYRGEGRFAGFKTPIDELPRDRAVLRVRGLVIRPVTRSASRASARTGQPQPTRG